MPPVMMPSAQLSKEEQYSTSESVLLGAGVRTAKNLFAKKVGQGFIMFQQKNAFFFRRYTLTVFVHISTRFSCPGT